MTDNFSTDSLKALLKTVKYPGFNRDIISFGLVREAAFEQGKATIALTLTSADPKIGDQIKAAVHKTLSAEPAIRDIQIDVTVLPHKNTGTATTMPKNLAQVRTVVAIASGKGGVGKSTFSVNFACALSRILEAQGKPNAVGIMDCDIYGPSVPLMMGLSGRPEITEQSELIPLENFGIKVMSMGFLIDETAPVVWRGPMITKTIQQFADCVAWGPLEVLVIDLPPGTGDAHLTLAQTIPLQGAIIVTTPQRAASNVATRGALMFQKVNVPYLGVVENMSYFEEPATRQHLSLFGDGGGILTAEALETELLGQIPLDPQIRQGGDFGIPIVLSHPNSPATKAIQNIASQVLTKLQKHDPLP